MNRKLIIETTPAETRAALLIDDVVAGLWCSGENERGTVYLAKVKQVDQRLEGAFLDIGTGRDGFLPFVGAQALHEGQLLPVQIKRPAIGDKGSLLTRDLVLETALMIWRPTAGKRRLVLAREVSVPEERQRLQSALDDKGFKGELTLRPFAGGMAADAVREAFTHLRQSYDALLEEAKITKTPARLAMQRHPAVSAFIYFADRLPQNIIVSGPSAFLSLKSSLGAHLSHRHIEIDNYQGTNLFEETCAEEAIDEALARVVTLQGGGRLTFDEAEAMTVIDVDVAATSGQSRRGSIIRVAVEAVPVIIRQLQLRHIGGQVIVDFPAIAVKGSGQLASVLKEEIRKIPGARFGRIDQNGLAVLILPRRELSLLEQMTETCGSGPIQGRRMTIHVIAAKLIRQAIVQLQTNPAAKLEACAAPVTIDYLNAREHLFQPLCETYGDRLSLVAVADSERGWIDVKES